MAFNGRTGNYTGAYPAGYGYQAPYWPQVQQPVMVQQETNTRMVEVESAESIRAAQETPVGSYARDREGRYTRENRNGGYSRGMDWNEHLRMMMDEAPDEATRMDIKKLMDRMAG